MEIKVYNREGEIRCLVTRLEYNGEWMSECSVTFDLESERPVDFEIGDWLEYRGERFELHYEPSVTEVAKDGTYGAAYSYKDVKFVSLAEEMVNADFLDYVLGDNGLHYSGLSDFSFYAESVKELANRLQANMNRYCSQNGLPTWKIEVSEEAVGERGLNISVSNLSCFDALGLVQSQFGLNFTIRGRVVTIGSGGLPVGHVFRMGKDQQGGLLGLYEFMRDAESDQKIVTRLRAFGSDRNLPRRYYNKLTDADGVKLVPDNMAIQRLMLPDFPYKTLDPYLDSDNITQLGVREDTIYFDGSGDLEDIYPSIENATADDLKEAGYDCKSSGRLDELEFGSDVTDNGVGEEQGNEIIPESETFTVVIKDIGFDIMDYLTEESPKIAFTSGMLGGREFEIYTTADQRPQQSNDGSWTLTLKREYDESIGLFFPYDRYNAKSGDTFVLLGIEMPDIYIKISSQRLLKAAKEYLRKNDYARSVFTPKVDEIFMARQHQRYLKGQESESLYFTIKEGSLLMFEDDGLNLTLSSVFIDKLTIKEGEGEVPTYDITLREEKSVGTLQRLQNQIDSLRSGGAGGGYDTDQLRQLIQVLGQRYFLRKDGIPDTSTSRTYFEETVSSKDWRQGKIPGEGLGWGMYHDENGNSVIETDNIVVRQEMFVNSLTVNQIKAIGGMNLYSIASIEVSKVEEYSNYYRCYFDLKEDYIANLFRIDDIGYCHRFTPENTELKFYKRRIVGVGKDYIDLTKGYAARQIEVRTGIVSDTGVIGSGVPAKGDVIAQFGSYVDKNRQFVIILDVQGGGYLRFLGGLDWVNAAGKEYGFQGYQSSTGERWFIGDKDSGQWAEYVDNKLTLCCELSVQSKVGDSSLEQYIQNLIPDITQEDIEGFVQNIVGDDLDFLKKQVDGAIETWYWTGEPTMSNYPVNTWQQSEYYAHIGDLYYDRESGYAYRFMQDGGEYKWVMIQDTDITTALANAKEASELAKSKRTIYGQRPNPPYEEGDLWVDATYPEGNTETDSANHKFFNDILVCISSRDSGNFSIYDWELASKYTDDTLAQKAMDEIGGYVYLKDAMENGSTSVLGGLILSSLIQLGSKNSLGQWEVWSGISGSMLKQAKGTEGIAAWYGGDMWDYEKDYNASYPDRRYAQSLFRFDGSGYLAGGKISWKSDGSGFLAGGKLWWDSKGSLHLNNGIYIGEDENKTLGSLVTAMNKFTLALTPIIKSGDSTKEGTWEEVTDDNLVAIKSTAGFYSMSFISARGMNSGSSSGSGLNFNVTNPKEGQGLIYRNGKWVNEDIATGGGLNYTELQEYLSTNGYAKTANVTKSLTIQRNGSQIGSYNGLGAVTININVPTNTNELTNGAGFITSSGSVGSANQLTTARTLWGQSFNGTANVSGALSNTGTITPSLGNSYSLGSATLTWLYTYTRYVVSTAALYLQGADDYGIYFRTGSTIRAILTTAGRFGIGTQSPNKLFHVAGTAQVDGQLTINYLSATSTASLYSMNSSMGAGTYQQICMGKSGNNYNALVIGYNHSGDDSTSNYAYFRVWGTGSTLVVNGAGNVGIGTSSPSYKLHVAGNIFSTGEIISTNPNSFRLAYNNYGTILRIDENAFYLLLTASGDRFGTWNSLRPLSVTLSNGHINMCSGTLYVQHGGNVGIGTTSPAYKLEVNGSISANGSSTLKFAGLNASLGANTNLQFQLGKNSNTYNKLCIDYYHVADGSSSNYMRIFMTGGTVGLTQNGLGYVGIGVTAPSYRLHVSGVIYATTGIFSNGYVSSRGQNTSSDERLKDEFLPINLSLAQIANAPGVFFRWKKDGSQDFGSVAQYWQRINPLFARNDFNGYLSLDYGKLAMIGLIRVAKEVETDRERLRRHEKEDRERLRRLEKEVYELKRKLRESV